MSIFNSLGSNYSGRLVWRSLLPASPTSRLKLLTNLSQRYQSEHIFLTYKGREAITLILQQLELPAGSVVAINGYTCYVVYAAVQAADLKPYMLDITSDSLNFTAQALEQAVSKEPTIKAVIIQNTLGIGCDIDGIKSVCERHGLTLVEDLAHSAGLKYADGREAGTVGLAAALSFSQDKIIDGVSGGAAILHRQPTAKPSSRRVGFAQQLQAFFYPLNSLIVRSTHKLGFGKLWLRLLKSLKLLPNQMAGDPKTLRSLPAHQASLVHAAMTELPETLVHRQKIAAIYHTHLSNNIQLPYDKAALYIRFPLLVENPRGLEKYLREHGVYIAQPWYDAVIAPGRYLPLTDYKIGTCPEAEKVADHIINLPTHIHVSEQQAKVIAEKVKTWLLSQ